HRLLRRLARGPHASVIRDVSTGGLLVALAETLGEVGAEVDLSRAPGRAPRWDYLLFSESHGRAIVVTDEPDRVLEEAREAGVPAAVVGEVTGDEVLRIEAGSSRLEVSRETLETWWSEPLKHLE
ncbi:MAG: AIR synthase-related protein, partial [Euryarchaeota archaeon]